MKFGVFLPVSGRASGRKTLMEAAESAEAWGFDSIWAADRIIIPWDINTPYPYAEKSEFIVPADRPFLEPLTCLAFLAACTEKITLGISVLVMPYRHPMYWAKIATSIDVLSEGRFVLGVGVGWMKEEFDALGSPFEDRGAVGNEQLEIWNRLVGDERPRFDGRFYRFDNVAFYPKSYGDERVPIWVGGEGARAQRRAARYGDAWFPYFVKITPEELALRYEKVKKFAEEQGRDPQAVQLNCCRPIELTDEPVAQRDDTLRGSADQLKKTLALYRDIGVETLALQFMVPRYPDRMKQIERFARDVMTKL